MYSCCRHLRKLAGLQEIATSLSGLAITSDSDSNVCGPICLAIKKDNPRLQAGVVIARVVEV